MAKTVNVNFRMDSALKQQMEAICGELGMSLTTAFTIFARKVCREKTTPFEVTTVTSMPVEQKSKFILPKKTMPELLRRNLDYCKRKKTIL